jgi:hypothetical protein
VAAAFALVAGAIASCEQAPPGSFLTPTGLDESADFVSAFSAIQIVGDFNGFDAGVSPMTFRSGVWSDTLTIQPGCYLMKFRTNNDWDETADFGRCSGSEDSCQVTVPADGTTVSEPVCAVTGTGTAIGEVEFLDAGSYLFELDEPQSSYRISRLANVGSISGTVAFAGPDRARIAATITVLEGGTQNTVTQVASDPNDGTFLVEGLAPGTYDLLAQASGYQSAAVNGVVVVALQDTNVGTITLVTGCSYLHTDMQVVGDFNGFDANAPSMSQIGNCVWADTLQVAAGCHFLKFRTDGTWDPDFGRCSGSEGTCQVTVPADGTAVTDSTCEVSGSGTALGEVEFLSTGEYEFLLDESGPSFSIRSLATTPTGSISGTVTFSDAPAPSPAATITVFSAGTTTQVGAGSSNPADGSFTVGGIPTGTFDVRARATNYADSVLTGVSVVAPGDTDVGTMMLLKACASGYSSVSVQLVTLGQQFPMTQITACVWADTVSFGAGDCTSLRFPTSDAAKSFLRCSGLEGICSVAIPSNGSTYSETVCAKASGQFIGEISLSAAGSYEIVLDEGAAQAVDEAVLRIRKLP